MPQMAPLNWLTLMILFTIVILMINCFNFFMKSYNPTKKSSEKTSTLINWKW
uniref:ATP synthase complex subunit 8 n=1 Tax=Cucujoidea sp. 37 KM-2017 TaxID=2219375 RepID=A0A346RGR9_9CUCU|nr:ATP synthase F0 subunit 8 [Cucujoidea sp. 37 KM-2017]